MEHTGWTWGKLLEYGVKELAAAGMEEAKEDTRFLLFACFGIRQAEYLLHRDREADEEQSECFLEWIERRKQGCPVQYITGEQWFMGLDFLVEPSVLIPRMDTEILVDRVLQELPQDGDTLIGADICTGSGCIAISLSRLGPKNLMMLATDISQDALKTARANAYRLLSDGRVEFYQGDLFHALPGQYQGKLDFIVSNPPYIPTLEIEGLDRNVKDYEPRMALDGGADGLSFYRRIACQLDEYLKPGGRLYLEIGCEQGAVVRAIIEQSGMEEVRIFQDLENRDRVVSAKKPL